MVNDVSLSHLMNWSTNGDSIVIWNERELSAILPQYGFKTNSFAAFQRQLNYYGFKKVNGEFKHELFYKGSKFLKNIKKRTGKNAPSAKKNNTTKRRNNKTREESDSEEEYSTPSSPVSPRSPVLPVTAHSTRQTVNNDETKMLREEVARLRAQQEETHMFMRQFFIELEQSRQETQMLKNLVLQLSEEIQRGKDVKEFSETFIPSIQAEEAFIPAIQTEELPTTPIPQPLPVQQEETQEEFQFQLTQEEFTFFTQESQFTQEEVSQMIDNLLEDM